MISLNNVMRIIRRWGNSIISLRLIFLEIPHKNIWVSWGVLFKGLGVQKGTQTPCWLRLCPKVIFLGDNASWPVISKSLSLWFERFFCSCKNSIGTLLAPFCLFWFLFPCLSFFHWTVISMGDFDLILFGLVRCVYIAFGTQKIIYNGD